MFPADPSLLGTTSKPPFKSELKTVHSLETTPESLDAYADSLQRQVAAGRERALSRRHGVRDVVRRIRRIG
jgi:cob(I)alamin adenosyltransferase